MREWAARSGEAEMTLMTRRSIILAGTTTMGALLCRPAIADVGAPERTPETDEISVGSGQTYVVRRTTRARLVTIAKGGTITAPEGYSLTMTVDGVETGGVLTETAGSDTKIAPGTYRGNIVLTVAKANPVTWNGVSKTFVFPFRQALFVDDTGLVASTSVLAAAVGGRVAAHDASGVSIVSAGEVFDGVYVTDGTYTLRNSRIALDGNGRCDFVGYGAAIVGTGTTTRLVVDHAQVSNRGAVRSGVIADGGANVVVKNSRIHTRDRRRRADRRAEHGADLRPREGRGRHLGDPDQAPRRHDQLGELRAAR
ncbi:hypothetical protein GCM10029978_076320 [Actinoallomurus acanthiterrae]